MRFALALVACLGCSENPDLKDTPPGDTDPMDTATPDTAAPDTGTPDTATGPCVHSGAAIQHSGNIIANETWAAGVHEVRSTITIRGNATLTVEPCALVKVVANQAIRVGTGNVGDGGTLVAKGTADRPIRIEAVADAWGDILVSSQGRADLAYVEIVGGGSMAGSRAGATLHLFGDQTQPLQALAKVNNVTIEGSAKYGVITEGHGGFDSASDALTIRRSAQMPFFVTAPSLGTIPNGTYTGNTTDAIRVSGTGAYEAIDKDVTIRERGVPYVIGGEGRFGELSVVGAMGTVPVLTIEAGVTIRFIKNGGLYIERATGTFAAKGALVIKGTAAKPVVLTSAEPAPAAGNWIGVWFGGKPAPANSVEYARIEYAGGATGTVNFSCGTPPRTDSARNEAAVLILGEPTTAFIKNTTIAKSAANGIERGWWGGPTSFLPTNTFTDVAYCQETYPRDSSGGCPMTVPCPR